MDHSPKNRLSDAAKDEFLQHCELRPYRAHDYINRPEYLMLIIEGSVAGQQTGHNQRYDLILETFDPGQFVGETGFFNAADPSGYYISARSDVLIGEIRCTKLHDLLAGDMKHRAAEIMSVIAAQFFERLQRMQRNYIDALQMDVLGRVAQLLLDLARNRAITHPEGRQIKITRQEIGQMVGCSRERAGQAIKHLAEQNLISAYGKTIVIFGEHK